MANADPFTAGWEEALDKLDVEGDPDTPAVTGKVKEPEVDAEGDDPAPAAAASEDPPAATGDEDQPASDEEDSSDANAVVQNTATAPAADPAPDVRAAPEQEEFKLPEFVLTDEEKEARHNFEKEGVASAAAVRSYIRESEINTQNQMVNALARTLGHINEQLAPIQQSTQTLTKERHFEALGKAVPDHQKIAPKVKQWIEKKPGALRNMYQDVYDNGSVEEVADIVATYRRETGQATAPSEPRTEAPATRPAAAKPSRKAESMAPVRTETTQPSDLAADDPNDFDSAFNDAIADDK